MKTPVEVEKVEIISSGLDEQMFVSWWFGNSFLYFFPPENIQVYDSEAAQQVMLQLTNSTDNTAWQAFVRVVYIDHNIENTR